MKISICFFALVPFLISACSPRAEFIPENEILKSATVGKPYFYKVNILGGGVIGLKEYKPAKVIPNDTGIDVKNCTGTEVRWIGKDRIDTNDYNCVEIFGTPTKAGTIKIKLSGAMYGNMWVSAGEFRKTYTLQVNNP